MFGTVLLSDVLEMPSFELGDDKEQKVRELLDLKRSDDFYPDLVESVFDNGICNPVLIINGVFINGHHRVAAAMDLGLEEIPFTSEDDKGWTENWPEDKIPAAWTWDED